MNETSRSAVNLTEPTANRPALPAALWALLFGNLVIGSGVLVIFGALNDLSASLDISTAKAGQIITAGAISMCISAPFLATFIGTIDRRKLLTFTLLWYAALLVLSAFMTDFIGLVVVRVLTVLAPALYTAQAAVCAGLLVPVEQRGKAITLVMLGWGMAMVVGVPMSAWISGHYGWERAVLLVAILALISAVWLWLKLPAGMQPPTLRKSQWIKLWQHPVLIRGALVTVFYSAGQFVLFAYMAPVMRDQVGLSIEEFSSVLVWLGLWGVAGSLLISQFIDRLGTSRVVHICMLMIAIPLALFPVVKSLWMSFLLLAPWGMAFIAIHSTQQARQINTAPELASATMALSTSGMYIGQGLGAAVGGGILAAGYMPWLGPAGMLITILGMGLSISLRRRDSV